MRRACYISVPEGHSVNDSISKDLASLSYVSLDLVIAAVLTLGKGAKIAKMNIHQAYHNTPVHPDDRPLLGMQWHAS